jgi:chromate transport protein ChrA
MKPKTKDNLIYLGVGALASALLAFYIFFTDRRYGRIPPIPEQILWALISTPIAVALVLERFWHLRHRTLVWLSAGLVALCNIGVLYVAYSMIWNPPVVVFGAITGLIIFVAIIFTKDRMR